MSRQQLIQEEAATRVRRLPLPDPRGALYIAGIGLLLTLGPVAGSSRPADVWLLVPLLLLTAVPLLWVTRAPMTVLLLVIALQTVVFTLLDGFRLPGAEFALIAVLIALGTVTARRPLWMSLLALLLVWGDLVATQMIAFPWTEIQWILQLSTTIALLAWGIGLVAHYGRARLDRVRAAHEVAAAAVAGERTRIASELNGIISGDVDRMRRHAATAREAMPADRGRAGDALAVIESVGVEAMNELRRLLHVLRDDAADALEDGRSRTDGTGRSLRQRLGGLERPDVVGAVAAITATVVVTAASLTGAERGLASAYIAVTLLVLLWRRRFPVTVLALVIVALVGAVLLFHDGDFLWDTLIPAVPLLVALFAVASVRSAWVSLPAVLVVWAYLAVPELLYPQVLVQNLVADGVVVLTVWAAGAYAGKRGRQIADLQSGQDAAARALAAERASLAYDLHDVIGHSITVMVVQSAGARRIIDRDPDRVGEALTAIERAGEEASAELDQLVRVLSEPESEGTRENDEPLRLADIDELVERTRPAVGRIAVHREGTARRLEPSVDLAAFCVIREALANAAKHDGPEAFIEVTLAWGVDELQLRITSSRAGEEPSHAAQLSTGYGLIGVRERVRIAGGAIDWSRASEDGSFAVVATLPVAGEGVTAGL